MNRINGLMVAGQGASTAALRQKIAGATAFRDVTAVAQLQSQWMFPNFLPGVLQKIAQGLVIGLTGDHIAGGLTHML